MHYFPNAPRIIGLRSTSITYLITYNSVCEIDQINSDMSLIIHMSVILFKFSKNIFNKKNLILMENEIIKFKTSELILQFL